VVLCLFHEHRLLHPQAVCINVFFSSQFVRCGRTLEFLDIDGNDIGPSNVKDLADAIRVNNSLLTLKLARNKVNDVGAWDLAEALKVNRTLTVLDLTRKYSE
jgi:hypothetical protein